MKDGIFRVPHIPRPPILPSFPSLPSFYSDVSKWLIRHPNPNPLCPRCLQFVVQNQAHQFCPTIGRLLNKKDQITTKIKINFFALSFCCGGMGGNRPFLALPVEQFLSLSPSLLPLWLALPFSPVCSRTALGLCLQPISSSSV